MLTYRCIDYLETEYQYLYGKNHSEYKELIRPFASSILEKINFCDAPYHNLEHTVQVVLAGQEIISGKHLCGEPISPRRWFNFIISLLCHDIGYVKGVCREDRPEENTFVTGVDGRQVTLLPAATGASLTPYHVDRGKLFVQENFSSCPQIDVEKVQRNIELTRFPVPKDKLHQDTRNLPGLARAADLIGQLADPAYLAKLPALFSEFEEVGSNKVLGYSNPTNLRTGYPKFYWQFVSLYLKHAIRYLEVSKTGKPILENLYNNRAVVEKELARYYNDHENPLKVLWQRLASLVPRSLKSS